VRSRSIARRRLRAAFLLYFSGFLVCWFYTLDYSFDMVGKCGGGGRGGTIRRFIIAFSFL
jgi:hypothetical protein